MPNLFLFVISRPLHSVCKLLINPFPDHVPDKLKRQNRCVVITKTVWWNKCVVVFVHDFQVLTLVHRALKQLSDSELRKVSPESLELKTMVLVKVFGNL